MKPDVAIVLGTWNRLPKLKRFVASVRRAAGELDYVLLAADGASEDGTPAWLREQPDCELLDGGRRGFVRAMNVGTARAVNLGAASAFLANDDLEFIDDDILERAFDRLQREKDLGAIAFACDRYPDRGFMWELIDGYVYCNQGLVRLEAGMAVGRASGDPTGRRWYHDGYHTYAADDEFGCRLQRLGWRILAVPAFKIHDDILDVRDPLRVANLKHLDEGLKTFKARWGVPAAADYRAADAIRFGGLRHAATPPSRRLVDVVGKTFLRAPQPAAVELLEPRPWPSVSCLMVTHHGPKMAAEAIAQFKAQDYPGKLELVVLDNGTDRVEELCAGDDRIVYRWEEGQPVRSLGELRNDSHALSTGDITVEWDDDDARSSGFVTALVQALLDHPEAHYACMGGPFRVQMGPSRANWLWDIRGPHDGTLAIWRAHWEPFVVGLVQGEKGPYVQRVVDHKPAHPGIHVPGQHLWVYRIHDHNTWAGQAGRGERMRLLPLPPEMRSTLPESDRGVVTISDAKYYPQLKLCLDSLMSVCPCAVKVFDIGLMADQVAELAARGIATFKAPASAEQFVDEKATAGSRYAWAKSFVLRDAPLWKRTIWLDSDTYVLKSLDPLFEMLEKRAVITPELFTAPLCQNKDELYARLPVKRRVLGLAINAGVMGFDRERDADIIDAWCAFVERCFTEPELKPLVSWYDQGALLWTVQAIDRVDAVLKEPTWNYLAGQNTQGHRNAYHVDRLREEIAAEHPGAAIVHWAGLNKLDWRLLPPAATPAAAVAGPTRPKLRAHVHRRRL